MTCRFSSFSRSAGAASSAHRSHWTSSSSVSASATSAMRSLRSSSLITRPDSYQTVVRHRRWREIRCDRTRPALTARTAFPLMTSDWQISDRCRTIGQILGISVCGPPAQTPLGEKFRLGLRHDLAQPNHGPLQRFARRVRTRQAFDGRELPVAVSEFRASDDQPSITVLQALESIPVTLPHLFVQQPSMLWRRILKGTKGFLRRRDTAGVQTPSGASQLVLDAVLHGAPQIAPQGAHVLRLEPVEPRECVMKDVLRQIARGDPIAGPLRQPAPRASPHPRRIPCEQNVDRRDSPLPHPFQKTLLGTAAVRNIFRSTASTLETCGPLS